jgi:hypothetical protein
MKAIPEGAAGARFIATTFHNLDQNTPVTIGVAFERNMEPLADAVDVLSFHDYLQTRAAISRDIARAKAFAAGAGKPVINTEIGCVARANPYDVTLEEHVNAGVGWYIWELMITKRWGNVHGVFYPDGTAANVVLTIRDKKSQSVTVSVRPLTGAVTVSKIVRGASR